MYTRFLYLRGRKGGRNGSEGGSATPHAHGKTQKPPKCQVSRTKYPTIFHFGNNSTPFDTHQLTPNHLVSHKSPNPQHQTPLLNLLEVCYPQALFISPSPQRLIPPSIHPPIKQKTPIVETTGEHKKKLN